MLSLHAPALAAAQPAANPAPVASAQGAADPVPATVKTKSNSVPEPSSLMMLGIGVAGVLIGRFVASRRSRKDRTP